MDTSLEDDETGDPIARLARTRFKIDFLYPLQRMAIANVLDAEDSPDPIRQMVLFPTGFGKSICFQLPALVTVGLTVVVYPLLALMSDQRHSLDGRKIANVLLRGAMTEEEWTQAQRMLDTKSAQIVVTNPETLEQPRVQKLLLRNKVFHLAVDEAHCVSEWGETFRPSYLKLKNAIEALEPRVISAYTATASPAVEKAIAKHLFGESPYRIVTTDIDKPNIIYRVEQTMEPIHTLLRLVNTKPKPLIVFDQSRDEVRLLCETIHQRTNLDVRFYHAGLSRAEKETIETWFMGSEDGVLVSTCAYGMGVDKRNIRTVIHFREPPSVEAYIQESGRAGRDGSIAEAILIHRDKEQEHKDSTVRNLDKCTTGNTEACNNPPETREQRRLAFLEYARSSSCRRRYLLKLMGQDLDSPCSGCDVCFGESARHPEGYSELYEFFSKNQNRFSYAESLRLLCLDDARSFVGNTPTCAGAGILSSWNKEDARVLLDVAIGRGLVVSNRKFPWKDRLCLHLT